MSANVKPFEMNMLQDLQKIEGESRELYTDFPVWATWVYSNNPELKPENIRVSFSGDRITGYGHIIPRPAFEDDPVEMPHTLFFDMNVSPEILNPSEVYQALFQALEIRGNELLEAYPQRRAEWCIQHYGTVEPQLDFVQNKGFHKTESYWLLEKSLKKKEQSEREVHGFNVEQWELESWEEQQLFLSLEKQAFPEEMPTLENLIALKALPMWKTYIATNSSSDIVGLIMMHYDPEVKKGYIDDIFTLSEYRNNGIGRVLLSKALQYFSEAGVNAVQLHVADTNLAAFHIYQQADFRGVKEKIELRMAFR
ncbi:GNAT family N-acetyltransferase [Neobacillus mesonae]|nr:GNAT family N-acetyltransferase [Neobacillus mesonae]